MSPKIIIDSFIQTLIFHKLLSKIYKLKHVQNESIWDGIKCAYQVSSFIGYHHIT